MSRIISIKELAQEYQQIYDHILEEFGDDFIEHYESLLQRKWSRASKKEAESFIRSRLNILTSNESDEIISDRLILLNGQLTNKNDEVKDLVRFLIDHEKETMFVLYLAGTFKGDLRIINTFSEKKVIKTKIKKPTPDISKSKVKDTNHLAHFWYTTGIDDYLPDGCVDDVVDGPRKIYNIHDYLPLNFNEYRDKDIAKERWLCDWVYDNHKEEEGTIDALLRLCVNVFGSRVVFFNKRYEELESYFSARNRIDGYLKDRMEKRLVAKQRGGKIDLYECIDKIDFPLDAEVSNLDKFLSQDKFIDRYKPLSDSWFIPVYIKFAIPALFDAICEGKKHTLRGTDNFILRDVLVRPLRDNIERNLLHGERSDDQEYEEKPQRNVMEYTSAHGSNTKTCPLILDSPEVPLVMKVVPGKTHGRRIFNAVGEPGWEIHLEATKKPVMRRIYNKKWGKVSFKVCDSLPDEDPPGSGENELDRREHYDIDYQRDIAEIKDVSHNPNLQSIPEELDRLADLNLKYPRLLDKFDDLKLKYYGPLDKIEEEYPDIEMGKTIEGLLDAADLDECEKKSVKAEYWWYYKDHEKHRGIIHINGYSEKEIAKEYHVKVSTVWQWRKRGMDKIRKYLKRLEDH